MWREVYNVYSAALSRLACVTSIQRGSRGEVKFEHEVQGESKVQLLGYDHAWRSPHASHSTLTSPFLPFVRKPHRLKLEWSLSQANWKWPNCDQTAVELTTRNLYSWVAKFVIKVSVSSLHSDLTHARIWLRNGFTLNPHGLTARVFLTWFETFFMYTSKSFIKS